jgi:hypothetical protein
VSLSLLETHACQGLGTEGYMRAGWRVTAVDIAKRHQRYNPAIEYRIVDAVKAIQIEGPLHAATHASPPCQWYTRGNAPRRGTETKWERSIPPVRETLQSTGRPYVIENVKDAVWDMVDPIMLCGCMFGLVAIDDDETLLHLRRPRLFELSWEPDVRLAEHTIEVKGTKYVVRVPKTCLHRASQQVAGVYGGARRNKAEAKNIRKGGYVPPNKQVAKALMGLAPERKVTWEGLYEGLPPAYTEWIGTLLREHVLSEQGARVTS